MATHGALAEERTRPQPFELDIDLVVDTSAAARSDRLEDTVDYGAATERAAQVARSTSFHLLEALADAVATAMVELETLNGTLLPAVTLTGSTTVVRGTPEVGPNGLAQIPTQIVALTLNGTSPFGPVGIGLQSDQNSTGMINQLNLGDPFPATSFFDVFTDISIGGETYHNRVADNLSATITEIPPSGGTIYSGPGGASKSILLLEPNGTPAYILVGSYFIAGSVGCFFFTNDSLPLGGPVCNPNSNDLQVNFTQIPGAGCEAGFLFGGASVGKPDVCPGSSNQLEVNWTGTKLGPAISSCDWENSGVPVGTCVVPSPPQPDGFALALVNITAVSWTIDGQVVGTPILPPAVGANDVEFFL